MSKEILINCTAKSRSLATPITYRSIPIGLSLCSRNGNGLLKRRIELHILIEKHTPDIMLIQETHLKPTHTFNIPNYRYYRNVRITDERAVGELSS
ncbi:hypothetical protein TNCV_205301 [Trichonephila clavipes]|nr:hypothetical protein TNCV_205301 [Trichonephila clavipes]